MPDRIITFCQYQEAPEYRYFLTERQPQMGDYVYIRERGAFTAVQLIGHPNQLNSNHPVITKTNNPQYTTIYQEDF